MKTIFCLLIVSFSALADWSTRETALLRVTPFAMPARVPLSLNWLVPANVESLPKGMQIVVQPRSGIVLPVGDEYRVTVRYRGLDGKTYSVTRNLTPDKEGNAFVFVKCDVDEPLTMTAEPVDLSPKLADGGWIDGYLKVAAIQDESAIADAKWDVIHAESSPSQSKSIYIEAGTYDLGSTSSVVTRKHPIRRFYFEGGAWCNVWANPGGIQYEPCKEVQ